MISVPAMLLVVLTVRAARRQTLRAKAGENESCAATRIQCMARRFLALTAVCDCRLRKDRSILSLHRILRDRVAVIMSLVQVRALLNAKFDIKISKECDLAVREVKLEEAQKPAP